MVQANSQLQAGFVVVALDQSTVADRPKAASGLVVFVFEVGGQVGSLSPGDRQVEGLFAEKRLGKRRLIDPVDENSEADLRVPSARGSSQGV